MSWLCVAWPARAPALALLAHCAAARSCAGSTLKTLETVALANAACQSLRQVGLMIVSPMPSKRCLCRGCAVVWLRSVRWPCQLPERGLASELAWLLPRQMQGGHMCTAQCHQRAISRDPAQRAVSWPTWVLLRLHPFGYPGPGSESAVMRRHRSVASARDGRPRALSSLTGPWPLDNRVSGRQLSRRGAV